MSRDLAATGGARLLDGARLLPAVWRARHLGGAPYKLLLALTDRCNQRCAHCAIWRRGPSQELSPREVSRLLTSLPSLRWLDLTGGEVTLRPDYLELAAAVREVAGGLLFLHFATNGWSPERVSALAEGLSRLPGPRVVVTVSIDGPEEIHDRVRGRRGAFARAVASARALSRIDNVAVYVGTTLTPETGPKLKATCAALTRALPGLVPSRWHINPMARSDHFFGNAAMELPATGELRRWLAEVSRLRGLPRDPFALVEFLYLRNLGRFLEEERAPLPCQALSASIFVAPNGEVYPCHILSESLGNIRDHGGSVATLLATPAARSARARIARDGCGRCWTACEAYHAILAAPGRGLLRALSARPPSL